MKKQLGVFLIILALVFSCAFDAIYDSEEQPVPGEGYSDIMPEQSDDQQMPQEVSEPPADGEQPDQPSQDQTNETDPNNEQPQQVEDTPEQKYQGITDDQLNALQLLYTEMTDTGKADRKSVV